ncbi:ABC transporter ATP-binding protein [Pseudoroseicyclus sp. H15]
MARGPELTLQLDRLVFGGRTLFEGFTLHVPPGQVLALLGPSGVGKTTLLRIIGGAERGFQGEMRVGNQPAHEAPVPGYVFQDARLMPWLTVAGNLRAVAPGLSDGEIEELLGTVHLEGQADVFPHALSGGMQRRAALARALCVHPGMLLLDEPFVSLDRAVVRDLQGLFLRLIHEGSPTVVLVSHDPEDAARLADRVVLLSGRPVRIPADITPKVPAHERSEADVRNILAELREAAGEEAVLT